MSTIPPFPSSDIEEDLELEIEVEIEEPWKVVVLNDPVNTMAYVTHVFQVVLGYDYQKSKKLMKEVHEQGQSIVWTGDREQAEHYVYVLQQWQLNAILCD